MKTKNYFPELKKVDTELILRIFTAAVDFSLNHLIFGKELDFHTLNYYRLF